MKYSKFIPKPIRDIVYDAYLNKKYSGLTKKNKGLKDAGEGKRVFLLATGPSIEKENLKLLTGEDCFSVSNFFLHQDAKLLHPKFHFFAPYHKPLILKNYIKWLKKADRELPQGTKIILSSRTKKIVDKHNLFLKREIFYLTLSPWMRNKIDLTKTILSPQTVPLMVLPVLLYMGYSEIYLLGCDHNVVKDYGKITKNFYNTQKDVRENATKNKAWGDIVQAHRDSLNVFLQYQKYKDKLKKQKIINLSQDSWLDIFERQSYKKKII